MFYSQVEVSFSSTLQYSSEDQMYRQLKRCFHSGDCNTENNGGKGKLKKKKKEGKGFWGFNQADKQGLCL